MQLFRVCPSLQSQELTETTGRRGEHKYHSIVNIQVGVLSIQTHSQSLRFCTFSICLLGEALEGEEVGLFEVSGNLRGNGVD